MMIACKTIIGLSVHICCETNVHNKIYFVLYETHFLVFNQKVYCN